VRAIIKVRAIILLTAIVTVLASSFFLSACSGKPRVFGQPITDYTISRIGDMLSHPEQFDGKAITIEGKIIEECPSGCWFNLKDNSGVMYVDINPSNFAIPQASGRHAVAQGSLKKEGLRITMIGKGVEIK
jgi:hypothetical protein